MTPPLKGVFGCCRLSVDRISGGALTLSRPIEAGDRGKVSNIVSMRGREMRDPSDYIRETLLRVTACVKAGVACVTGAIDIKAGQ
jgi:hypothetical protein